MDDDDVLARLDEQLEEVHVLARLLDDEATMLSMERLHLLLGAVSELQEPGRIPDQRAP